MLRDFFADFRQQRLRTALTILGITWGTVAVVVLLAFGTGLERQTRKRFHGLGDRIVILWGGRTTKSFMGFPEGRYIRLREEDVELLTREIPDIVMISPEYSNRSTPVRRGVQGANPNITGVLPVYGEMRNIISEEGGRFINSSMWTSAGGWRSWATSWRPCCSARSARWASRSSSGRSRSP